MHDHLLLKGNTLSIKAIHTSGSQSPGVREASPGGLRLFLVCYSGGNHNAHYQSYIFRGPSTEVKFNLMCSVGGKLRNRKLCHSKKYYLKIFNDVHEINPY